MRIFRWGTFLSLGGIVLGTGGIGKRTSPRWHVPVSAVCMFVFWIVAAEGE
jgi:hypothetical protein